MSGRSWKAGAVTLVAAFTLVSGALVESAPTGVSAAPAEKAPAQKARWAPQEGAKFNVPRSSLDNELRLERQVIGAINHSPKGSLIRFSMFSFDRMPVANALIRAKKRGVSVQVLVNNHEVTHAQRVMRKKLGKNRKKNSWIYQCTNGCRSSGENLHDKFYLFSQSGAARYVVMTGSINMKLNGAANQYNDLWTHNNDAELYSAFLDLFTRLKRDKQDHPGHITYNIDDGRMRLETTPFHGPGDKDPIMKILAPVKCTGATGSTGNHGRTVVRVIIHAWNAERGNRIAKRIRTLYAQGCDVKLLYGFTGAQVRATLSKPTSRGRVPIRSTGYDTRGDGGVLDGELDLYTHQKNLFISGHYGTSRNTQLVVTGSSNWTVDGLRGDEEIFTINGMGAYPYYAKDFNWLWKSRSHSVSWSPTSGADYHPVILDAPAIGGGGIDGRRMVDDPGSYEPAPSGPFWEGD